MVHLMILQNNSKVEHHHTLPLQLVVFDATAENCVEAAQATNAGVLHFRKQRHSCAD